MGKVHLTQSLDHYLHDHATEDEMFRLVELCDTSVMEQHWDGYLAWCKTEDGLQYLKGGSKYHEDDPVVAEAVKHMDIDDCRYGYHVPQGFFLR